MEEEECFLEGMGEEGGGLEVEVEAMEVEVEAMEEEEVAVAVEDVRLGSRGWKGTIWLVDGLSCRNNNDHKELISSFSLLRKELPHPREEAELVTEYSARATCIFERLEILFSECILIRLLASIQRRPLRLILE